MVSCAFWGVWQQGKISSGFPLTVLRRFLNPGWLSGRSALIHDLPGHSEKTSSARTHTHTNIASQVHISQTTPRLFYPGSSPGCHQGRPRCVLTPAHAHVSAVGDLDCNFFDRCFRSNETCDAFVVNAAVQIEPGCPLIPLKMEIVFSVNFSQCSAHGGDQGKRRDDRLPTPVEKLPHSSSRSRVAMLGGSRICCREARHLT